MGASDAFVKAFNRGDEENKEVHRIASDREIVDEVHRISGMQNERGELLARLSLADDIVKMRRELAHLTAEVKKLTKEVADIQFVLECRATTEGQLREALTDSQAEVDERKKANEILAGTVGELKMFLHNAQAEVDEAGKAIRNNSLVWHAPEYSHFEGWYRCLHCHETSSERERFPHTPTCIVLKYQPKEDRQ